MTTFTVTAAGGRSRTLLKSIRGPGATIEAVVLRPPKYRDIMAYGDPTSLIVMDGAMMPSEDMGVVQKYITTLVTDEAGAVIDPALLEQIDYRDALALKDAVLSFFREAALSVTSSTPPTP